MNAEKVCIFRVGCEAWMLAHAGQRQGLGMGLGYFLISFYFTSKTFPYNMSAQRFKVLTIFESNISLLWLCHKTMHLPYSFYMIC